MMIRRAFACINVNNSLVAILSIITYHCILHEKLNISVFFTTDLSQRPNETLKKNFNFRASSVWCRGESVNKRLCRFHNLCIHPEGEFLFLHGPESIISGLSLSKIKEAVVELASVEGHNALTLTLTDIPVDRIHELPWDVSYIEEKSFLLRRFKPNNLMHAIHDDLMPLFSTMIEIGMCDGEKNCDGKLVFVDLLREGPFWDVYKLFSKSEPILLTGLSSKSIYCFKESYVGVNRNTVWYQYGFNAPQSPWPRRTVNAIDIRRFTSYVTSSLSASLQPSVCPSYPVSVLLTRKHTRLILNEKQLFQTIQERTKSTVISLSLEDHSLVDIIAHVRCANIIVGMHGALLIIAAFLPPKSVLVELFPFAVPAEDYTPYKTLVNLPGMDIVYKVWVNSKEDDTVTHPDWPAHLGGIDHLPASKRKRILSDESVKPHLCCSDPQWLFRIFQDTVVDVESFGKVLEEGLIESEVESCDQNGMSDLWRRNMLPGRVYNLSCSVNEGIVFLSWDRPWNLKFFNKIEVIEYEIWYRAVGESESKLIVTDKTMMSIAGHNLPLDMWVRIRVNDKKGPFQWVVCKLN